MTTQTSEFLLVYYVIEIVLELSSKGLSGKCLGRWGGDTSRSVRVHLTQYVQDRELAT